MYLVCIDMATGTANRYQNNKKVGDGVIDRWAEFMAGKTNIILSCLEAYRVYGFQDETIKTT